ncbi:MAG: hypothetical protein ACRKGH_08610 [Dehalogenimonas sp.]
MNKCKFLIRKQQGQALILAMVMLAIGGLIIGPLVGLVTTSLNVGRNIEGQVTELYAADAGVERGIFALQEWYKIEPLPDPGEYIFPVLNFIVDNKNVSVTTEYVAGIPAFKLTSTATIGGNSTVIQSFVQDVTGDFSGILENVVTSQTEIETPSNDKQYEIIPDFGEEHGPVVPYTGAWPSPTEISEYYQYFLSDATIWESDNFDIEGVSTEFGALYRNGPISIKDSANNSTKFTLTLQGNWYITGNMEIGLNSKAFTLDLNGYTIFVENTGTLNPSGTGDDVLKISGGNNGVTVVGPGAIIAVGDIYFAPNIDANSTDPVFIMSVSGTTTLQPGGSFYGAIAGSVMVDLQPGTSVVYPDGGFEGTGIQFPGLTPGAFLGIKTYEINP